MKVKSIYALSALVLTAYSVEAQEIDDQSIAEFIGAETQLRDFLSLTTTRTQTFRATALELGVVKTVEIWCPAVDSIVVEYLPEWELNLIAAHRTAVPEDVLREATSTSPSEAQEVLSPYKVAIGMNMQMASNQLLKDAGAKVLEKMSNTAKERENELLLDDEEETKRRSSYNALTACASLSDGEDTD